jgi:hypothetical protein
MHATCPLVPVLYYYIPRDDCLIRTGVLTGVVFAGSVAQFLGAFTKLLKASSCLSVCPSVRVSACMEQIGSLWIDFHEMSIFR